MAEDIRVSAPGPDGNGFQLDLSQKKLGLTGPNVALLLLIIIIGAVAYLRTGTIDKTMKAGQEQMAATEDRVHKRVDALFIKMDKFIDDVHAQTLLLNANNAKIAAGQQELRSHIDTVATKQGDLVHQQTNAIDSKIVTLTQYIEKWFTEIGTRLEWLDHNVANPERRMPLRAPASHEDRHPERGR